MEGQNPLDQLRPNLLPDPVGLWPPAPGWWVLALLALLLVAWLGFILIRHWLRNRYRRVATRQARQVLADFEQHQCERQLVHDCNRLLKQVALHAFEPGTVARLFGHQWLTFLAEKGKAPEFLEDAAQALGDNRFNPECPLAASDARHVHQLTLRWIRKHHA